MSSIVESLAQIWNMVYHRFDQSITFLYNNFESGPMDQMFCKEFCLSPGGCFVQRTEPVGLFCQKAI